MANANLSSIESALKAQGVDWAKLLQIFAAVNATVPQMIALVQSFINALNAHPAMKSVAAGCCTPADLKAHFDAIQMLAACGSCCCDGCTP